MHRNDFLILGVMQLRNTFRILFSKTRMLQWSKLKFGKGFKGSPQLIGIASAALDRLHQSAFPFSSIGIRSPASHAKVGTIQSDLMARSWIFHDIESGAVAAAASHNPKHVTLVAKCRTAIWIFFAAVFYTVTRSIFIAFCTFETVPNFLERLLPVKSTLPE